MREIEILHQFMRINTDYGDGNGQGGTVNSPTRLHQPLQTAVAPALLEPYLLAWTNVITLLPSVVFQRLVFGTVGTEP